MFAKEDRLRSLNKTRFTMPTDMHLFVQLTVLLTVLAALYLLELIYLGEPPLIATFWSQGPDRFGDFWHYRALLDLMHTPEFFAARDRFAYPAPCALLYQWLYHLGPRPHVSYNIMLWTIEGSSAVVFFRALHRSGMGAGAAAGLVSLLTVTSYPWHFLYDRGNIELFVYVFVAAGVWAWLKGYDRAAAVLWGIAGSLKLYPVLLLVLFLKRDRWKIFLLGLVCCCGVLLFSFWYVGPSIRIAAMGTFSGVLGFVGHYGAHARSNELVFDHSVLGALKEVFELPALAGADDRVTKIGHGYEFLVTLAGPWAFLRWRKNAPPLNQLCLLLLALLLLPPVSYDYTLIYAYLVIGIVLCCVVAAARRGTGLPGARLYMIAFAVICTPETWLFLHELRPNGLLKCVALLSVALNVMRHPLELTELTRGAGSLRGTDLAGGRQGADVRHDESGVKAALSPSSTKVHPVQA